MANENSISENPINPANPANPANPEKFNFLENSIWPFLKNNLDELFPTIEAFSA